MSALIERAAIADRRAGQLSSSADRGGRALVILIVLSWFASFVIGFKVALAVLSIVGFAAAIGGMFRPWLGLLGVGLLCTLDPVMSSLLFTGGGLPWNTLNYWLLFVAFSALPLLLNYGSVQLRLLGAFAALVSLEVLVSPDWYTGLQNVSEIGVLFGVVVYFVRAGEQPAVWYWLGLVCGVTGLLGGTALVVQQASLPAINRNAWALFPLTALFVTCLAFPLARPWRRGLVTLMILAFANYGLVFLSGSRGALLTATGCGLLMLAQTRGVRGRWLVVVTGALVAVALTTQFTDLQTRTVDRIGYLLDSQQSVVNRTSGRSALAAGGWNIFLEHPLGVGTGGFAVARVDLNLARGELSGWRAREQRPAHSGWIKILAENGVPGIVLMGAFVLSFAVTGWRSRSRDLFVLGLLVTLAFSAGFLSTEYQSKGLWFLAAGALTLLHPGSVLRREALRSV